MMLISILSAILLVFGAILLLRRILVVVVVLGISMEPSLRAGDRLLVFRYWPSRLLRAGDVIVFSNPALDLDSIPSEEAEDGCASDSDELVAVFPSAQEGCHKNLVKRVVGTPNSVVKYDRNSGKVVGEEANQFKPEDIRTWSLDGSQFFLMGDSRHSVDSRTWGPVELHPQVGRVIARLQTRNPSNRGPKIVVPFERFK